eukprot:354014-Chlamydomonas_euryale.AAC.5
MFLTRWETAALAPPPPQTVLTLDISDIGKQNKVWGPHLACSPLDFSMVLGVDCAFRPPLLTLAASALGVELSLHTALHASSPTLLLPASPSSP